MALVMAQAWPLGPHPRTEGGAQWLGFWALGHGRVGYAGLEKAQVSRRHRRPPSWLGLEELGHPPPHTCIADHWEQGWSQAALLGFMLSGTNLSLGIVIELAQSPPHSSVPGLVPPAGSVRGAGSQAAFLGGWVLELGFGNGVNSHPQVGRGREMLT